MLPGFQKATRLMEIAKALRWIRTSALALAPRIEGRLDSVVKHGYSVPFGASTPPLPPPGSLLTLTTPSPASDDATLVFPLKSSLREPPVDR